jgi:phosphatidylserine/phosphatidylglycerophosphate/cardiolipin synthase-like enzyme
MKKISIITYILLLTGILYSQSSIEFVESIPLETNLDNPDIRNTQEVWLEMINNAKSSIDIEQFYVSNEKGEPLDTIIYSIISSANRGIKIRIISDANMYKTYPETLDSLSKVTNIEVRIIDFGKIAGGIQHSKFFIIDGEQMFLGSQNFDWRALKHIHELGVKIIDVDITQTFQGVFNLDWDLSKSDDPKSVMAKYIKVRFKNPVKTFIDGNDTMIITPVYSPTGFIPQESFWDIPRIISMIDSAKSKVILQFLSYNPLSRDDTYFSGLDSALYRAGDRGVNVQMIISDWNLGKKSIGYLKDLSSHKNIQVKYSAIPEWSGGYISFARVEHCKYIVADENICWLGTSNAEKSYYYDSRNIGLIIKSNKFSKRLTDIFTKSWNGTYTTLIEKDKEYKVRFHFEEK